MLNRGIIFFTIIVVLVGLLGWFIVNKWHYNNVQEEVRFTTRYRALSYAEAFSSTIEERFALLEGLHSFAKSLSEDNLEKNFDVYAEELYNLEQGIRNLSIAPHGIQKYVYPHTSNEVVTGHDLLRDPREEVSEDIHTNFESREIVVSGPYELRQGGEGLVARKAVYKKNEFWGLVAIVIDMPHVYEVCEFAKAKGLSFAIKDSSNRVLWGDTTVFKKNPVEVPIHISQEKLTIAALPQGGWKKAYREELLGFSITSFLLFLFLVVSIILFARKFSSVSEKSRQQEERYENIFNSIRDVIVVTDIGRRIIDINHQALKSMFGYNLSEVKGESTRVLYESSNYHEKVGQELLQTKAINDNTVLEILFKRKDSGVFPAELTAMNLYDKKRNVIGYVGIIRDISERTEHEKIIRENTLSQKMLNEIAAMYLSRQDYENIIHAAIKQLHSLFPQYRSAYSTIDREGNLTVKYSEQPEDMPDLTGIEVDLNPAKEYLYSLQTNRVTRIKNVEYDLKIQPLKAAIKEGNTYAVLDVAIPLRDEVRGLLCFDSPAPTDWTDHEIYILEEYANLLTLIMDNDAYQKKIKESNISLQETVKEKETLLTEVHHRVKNNLNVIVSLLKLQEDEIDSVDKAIEAFKASQRRIYSMALVHESLYKSDRLSEIDLGQYIQTLAGQLQYSLEGYKDIEYHYKLDPVSVNIIQAVPCGIIVNELITNAQKHGLKNSETGIISITLKKQDAAETISLSVEDNGKGLPEDFSIESAHSLGLNLVNILSRQIDGELIVDSSEGTSITINFPKN